LLSSATEIENMTEPMITYNKDGSLSCLTGKEAVELMRVQTIRMGIKMNIQTGGKMMLTRGATITNLLKMAGQYTGKTYTRSQKQQALDDLNMWFNNMKSTIPTETR
jgi:hypothetical protein